MTPRRCARDWLRRTRGSRSSRALASGSMRSRKSSSSCATVCTSPALRRLAGGAVWGGGRRPCSAGGACCRCGRSQLPLARARAMSALRFGSRFLGSHHVSAPANPAPQASGVWVESSDRHLHHIERELSGARHADHELFHSIQAAYPAPDRRRRGGPPARRASPSRHSFGDRRDAVETFGMQAPSSQVARAELLCAEGPALRIGSWWWRAGIEFAAVSQRCAERCDLSSGAEPLRRDLRA